jgi:hypothetical protein
MKLFELYGNILLKDDGVGRKLDTIDKKANKTSDSFKGLAKVVGGAVLIGAFKKLGTAMLNGAGDAEEMESKFNTVFDNISQEADKWAIGFQKAVGGSRYAIKGMLADSQDMLTGFGATTKEGFELSKQIQTLGTDLASFQNIKGGATVAVEKLRKGLLGETENLKSLGIVINDTVMKQELATQGDRRKLKELTQLEKIELRYQIAIKQSKNAIGDAEKTSGSYTNQLRALRGEIKDLVTDAGKKLIPVFTQIIKNIRKNEEAIKTVLNALAIVFTAFGKVLEFVIKNLDIIITLFVAVGSVLVASKITDLVLKAGDSFGKFTKFLTTFNPTTMKTVGIILLVVAALTALGAIIAVIMGRSRDMQNTFESIGSSVSGMGSKMKSDLSKNMSGNMNSFDVGINRIPHDMVAMVHEDEAVVPKDLNPFNPNAKKLGWLNNATQNNNSENKVINNYHINATIPVKDIDEVNKVSKVINELKQTVNQGIGGASFGY